VPQVLTQSDVKFLFGTLSRANYYQLQFGGLTPGLTNHLIARGVDGRFIGDSSGLLAYSASLPGSGLAAVESANFHGITENFAHTKLYTPLNVSFYCGTDYKSIKMFEHWMEYAVGGNRNISYGSKFYSYRMNYPDDPATGYKSEQTKIFKFEPNVERFMEYTFIGLYPESVNPVPLNYGSNGELTRVTVSLKYDRFIAGSSYSIDEARNSAFGIESVLGTAEGLFSGAQNFLSNFIN